MFTVLWNKSSKFTRFNSILILTLSFMSNCYAYDAQYNSSSGILTIPFLSLNNLHYSADLTLSDPSKFQFTLSNTNTFQRQTLSEPIYNTDNQSLFLPRILVNSQFFSARLTLSESDGALNFLATEIVLNNFTVSQGVQNTITAKSTGYDSYKDEGGGVQKIISHLNGSSTYATITSRKSSSGDDVTLKYLKHEPQDQESVKAILILIPGGDLDAGIDGDAETGKVSSSGTNFLLRSAHLFSDLGYRAISFDRPSDYMSFFTDLSDAGQRDLYRTSNEHATDISAILNIENPNNLPVILIGTSRGAISAVAQQHLATAIAISNPVTSGSGSPVGDSESPDILQASNLNKPIHILYHTEDGCGGTTPQNTLNLYTAYVDASKDVTLQGLSGGFIDEVIANPCGASHYHGFLGIETTAVGYTAAWLDNIIAK